MKLTTSSNPHIFSFHSTKKLMWIVVIALLPATIAGVLFFGIPALISVITAVGTALIVDNLMQKISGNKLGRFNGSAVITGLLFALTLPPATPFWIHIIGVTFAIAIGKYAFGPGNNIFNPALFGRAIVVISFPAILAASYRTANLAIDAVTSATPLTVAKFSGMDALISSMDNKVSVYLSLFFGNVSGALGETSALALLIGGGFLLFVKIIDYRIPLAYIGTVAVGMLAFGFDPIFHVLAGGLLLGALFMATDFVTIPLTSKGRWICGIGCGLFTVLFRIQSGMPEGVMYSILLMNMLTPLIDRYTKQKPFGKK